jgi:hypothetical protein
MNTNVIEEELPEMKYNRVIEIMKNVDWQKFHNLCKSVGNDFNSPQWRFLKATILEKAVAKYSGGMLRYVGEEERGCDFIIESLNNVKIEMKYTEECLFGGKEKRLKNTTKQITLLNSRGTNTHLNLPETYSDYLLIVEMNGAALIHKEALEEFVVSNGDSLSAKIPTNQLHIIFNPRDINQTQEFEKIYIKQTILESIERVL